MQMDVLTLGVGVISFGVFLIVQVITFRWLRPEELLKSLSACVVAIAVLPLVLMGILYVIKALDASMMAWIIAALLALFVAGLLSFIYILCVFGPYETSIRMRVVREIAKGGSKGISMQELLGAYSPEAIMNVRLQRLVGSGDVIEKDGIYQASGKKNFFFIFDAIACTIKKWIGR
jgi:hypothetical protein